MDLKNNKGVTLLVLTITIIVLLIITSITINNSKSQLGMKNVNQLYSDIESISTKVSDYYLKNNSLPIFQNHAYLSDSSQLSLLLIANGGDSNQIINPNDDGNYYVINLSKLENLTLNYGREYNNWSDSSSFQDYQDLYIINETTHQIYYPKGIKYNGNVYFTRDSMTETVEKVQGTSNYSMNRFEISSIEVNKTVSDSEKNQVVLEANITLNIDSNYKNDTLEYGWKAKDDTSDVAYTKFSLDSSNHAKLMSKQLEDNTNYYLYIKVMDLNGKERVIEEEVIIEEK